MTAPSWISALRRVRDNAVADASTRSSRWPAWPASTTTVFWVGFDIIPGDYEHFQTGRRTAATPGAAENRRPGAMADADLGLRHAARHRRRHRRYRLSLFPRQWNRRGGGSYRPAA